MTSVFVRYSKLKNGKVQCYTTGVWIKPEKAHCSHFVRRACYPLRWDLRNVRPSSAYSNVYLNGDLARYYRHLIKDGVDADNLLSIEDGWKKGKMKPHTMPQLKTLHDEWLDRINNSKLDHLLPKWKPLAKG